MKLCIKASQFPDHIGNLLHVCQGFEPDQLIDIQIDKRILFVPFIQFVEDFIALRAVVSAAQFIMVGTLCQPFLFCFIHKNIIYI